MTSQIAVNVDNSVIVNYLYSTVLSAATDGDAEFEYNKGTREYFQTAEIYIVAGGKAVGEFENLCERRKMLYKDIEDFIIETGQDVFEYDIGWGQRNNNPNDEGHLLRGVQMNMHMHETKAEQLSAIRRCFQQLSECKRKILDSEIDEIFEQFYDNNLSSEINNELDIDHDADIMVDAAYLSKENDIEILAAVDSDITGDGHQDIVLELIRQELDPDIELTIIDPQETPPKSISQR